MEAPQYKDALITLLVAIPPNLESISMYPLERYVRSPSPGTYERVNLLEDCYVGPPLFQNRCHTAKFTKY